MINRERIPTFSTDVLEGAETLLDSLIDNTPNHANRLLWIEASYLVKRELENRL